METTAIFAGQNLSGSKFLGNASAAQRYNDALKNPGDENAMCVLNFLQLLDVHVQYCRHLLQ